MTNLETEKLSIPEYPEELRTRVEEYSLKILENGRPGWDVPHTLAVVNWAYKLAVENGLDVKVLVTAAYLHDIGYYGQFAGLDVADYDNVQDKKQKHMVVGADMARIFLEGVEVKDLLTDEQRERVIHLVSIHDNIGKLQYLDELVLMEADTLGAIDLDFVEPTYKGEEALKYLEVTRSKRRSKFITVSAMENWDQMAEELANFVNLRDLEGKDLLRWGDEGPM